MIKNLILGGGPSGLSYSLFCPSDSKIIEKNSKPGGHASSFEINGFTFDYGPHILFSRDKKILSFIINSLGENISRCYRNVKISYKDRLIKYPFENDLGSLPLKENLECLKDFIFNNYKKKFKEPKNMEEWFLYTFGRSICEKYLLPYNEKVWNIKAHDLSMLWAERIPNPPIKDVIKSSLGIKTEGYKHQLYFHYPKKGGYQAISENWAKFVDINFQESVQEILQQDDKSFKIITNKSEYHSKHIISSINLSSFKNICKQWIDPDIVDAINNLVVNPMYIVSIGIEGKDPDKYAAIYFPEKEFLFNRISFPTTFSSLNSPPNHYSIQAEITYSKRDKSTATMSDDQIIKHVLDGLESKNIIKGKIKFTVLKRYEESYVVYDTNYEKNITKIRKYFSDNGITLIGRFGFFEYVNIDMALDRVVSILEQKYSQSRESLFSIATKKLKTI